MHMQDIKIEELLRINCQVLAIFTVPIFLLSLSRVLMYEYVEYVMGT